jgi:hypothetical protein
MDTKEFIDKINIIEKTIDLSKLKFRDFNPWPYIRMSIFYKWNNEDLKKPEDSTSTIFLIKIKNIFRSLLFYSKNRIKCEKVDIVYFTRLDWFKQSIDGDIFNKHSDAFYNLFSSIKSIKIIDLGVIFKNSSGVTYLDIVLKLEIYKFKMSNFINNLFNNNSQPFSMKKSIDQKIHDVFGLEAEYLEDLALIDVLSKRFMKILKGYNPKVVFLECFYYPYGMAISLACHRLGINCVEYQHGAPNNYQLMYAKWENIPLNGYEIIPNIFWMWGEQPRKVIDEWMRKTQTHKTIVGGNLWMIYFNHRNNAVDKTLSNIYSKDKTNILVSLYGDEYFPEYLLTCVEKFSDGYSWHFRNHPTNPISTELTDCILALKNTEIESSSKALLFDLLTITNIHITGYSTVAFEAQSYGVPSIFTHINAKNGYSDLLGRNGLYYAESKKELNLLINKLTVAEIEITPEYIVSTIDVARSALSAIMKMS